MNWKLMVLSALVLVALLMTVCDTAHAASWVAFDSPEWARLPELSPTQIVFTFEDDRLSLNTPSISEDTGSSSEAWSLLFSGNWAVCGTVDGSGNLVADPYGTFVYDGFGGYIDWSLDTPLGYNAPLMLGVSFVGNGAATYDEIADYEPTGITTSGTIVRWDSLPMRDGERGLYTDLSHTFYSGSAMAATSDVPEPSSVLAMLSGLGGLAGYVLRKKR